MPDLAQFLQELTVLQQVPWTWGASLAVPILVLLPVLWLLVRWPYRRALRGRDAHIDNLNHQVKSLARQAAEYEQQLNEVIATQARFDDALYQRGLPIGVVTGADVDLGRATARFATVTADDKLAEGMQVEFQDWLLAFESCAAFSSVQRDGRRSTTYRAAVFSVLGQRR